MADWTQADYTALKKAIASGVRKVQYQDKAVEYHSLDEMRGLLAQMKADLGLTEERGKPRRIYANHSKGT